MNNGNIDFDTFTKGVNTGHSLKANTKLHTEEGDFVHPAKYKAGKETTYNTFQVRTHECVLPGVALNSTQAEANCAKQALKKMLDSGALELPIPRIIFNPLIEEYSSKDVLDMAHGCSNTMIGRSLLNDVPFRDTDIGRAIYDSHPGDMTGLLLYAPTDLIFGTWDSHHRTPSAKRRQKVKPALRVARALSAEIYGVDFEPRTRAGVLKNVADFSATVPLKDEIKDHDKDKKSKKKGIEVITKYYGDMMFQEVKPKKGKSEGEPSAAGLAAVPFYEEGLGGGTIRYGIYTGHIPLPLLREYSFPREDGTVDEERNQAARTLTAALALLIQTVRIDSGFFLRSGCNLSPERPVFTLNGRYHDEVLFKGHIEVPQARQLLNQAMDQAAKHGLEWSGETIELTNSPEMRERFIMNLNWDRDEQE